MKNCPGNRKIRSEFRRTFRSQKWFQKRILCGQYSKYDGQTKVTNKMLSHLFLYGNNQQNLSNLIHNYCTMKKCNYAA